MIQKQWERLAVQWQYISPDTSGFVSNFGVLQGIKSIKPPRRIEVLPYAISRVSFDEAEHNNPFRPGHDTRLSGGLDAKIGILGNLTLDLTVNPDFGQVEADPSEVNLSAFESYFEEKRPFFIEGQDILSFGIGMGDGGLGSDNLFYSRRIGSRPYLSEVELDSTEYAKYPRKTTILSAGKITGKFDNGVSIGVLGAVTQEEKAKISNGTNTRREIVEPRTGYSLLKLQKEYREGQTGIGGTVTSVKRDIPNENFYDLNSSAYTGGVHLWHNWANKTYFVDAKLEGSKINGRKEAILAAQTSSSRYFQRPDVDHVEVDSSLTSMNGHAGSFMIGKQGNGKLRYVLASLWRSPGFEINDLGYNSRVDRVTNIIWVGYRENEKKGILRNYSINFNAWEGFNFNRDHLFAGGNINGHLTFTNYYSGWFGINREGNSLSYSSLRGGPMMKHEGAWNFWFGASTDRRKIIRFNANIFSHTNDDNISYSRRIRTGVNLQLNHRFKIDINPFYNYSVDDMQYVDEISSNNESRYIFGRINRKTVGTTLRLDISLTPKLSIQFYGQPFISAGDYSNYKHITNSKADNYKDRFHEYSSDEISYNEENDVYDVNIGSENYSIENYDFNFKEFYASMVVKWEFRPGSTLYFVYAHQQSHFAETGRFSYGENMRSLFRTNPQAVFLMKFNYWFSV